MAFASTWYVNFVLGSVPRFKINQLPWMVALVGSSFVITYVAIKLSNSMYLGGWSTGTRNYALPESEDKGHGASWVSKRFRGSFWGVLKKT